MVNSGRTVFSQIMDLLPKHEFHRCVERYQGHHKVKSFSCMDQFLCMAFAQLTFRESLRDIEASLRSIQSKLYHMGIRSLVSRNTLANANATRDWRIYADFAQVLIRQARELYGKDSIGIDLDETVYALDASTIDLCLSLFPWAKFRKQKGAVKLHTVIDVRGNIPTFIYISTGKMHDVKVLDVVIPEPGSIYLMDRAYVDFARLYTLNQECGFFVTRLKKNTKFERVYSRPVDKETGLRCDQTIKLTHPDSAKDYPDHLRRVGYYDQEKGRRFDYLTNHFNTSALNITELYRRRWQVELFFKWIKQNLRIKAFYGTTSNAVHTQIWIAVSVYVMIAIIKKRLNLKPSMNTILQVLSLTLYEKCPIDQILEQPEQKRNMASDQELFPLFYSLEEPIE